MSKIIKLKTYTDDRGDLTVLDKIEKLLPFKVRRVFYIYNVDDSQRGGHRHHKTIQAAICIKGSCSVSCNDGKNKKTYLLNSPDICLLLETKDWHTMENFSKDAVLLVLASEIFDKQDYIFGPYEN